MQTRTDSQSKKWGTRLNRNAWTPAEDWPDWANPHQREKWRKKGLIVWDQETQIVARLRGRQALAILAQLRDNDEWEQQGCVVGEPAWRLSLDNPDDKGPVLANQVVLDPEQATALFDSLVQEEGVLQKMAEEEEAEEGRVDDEQAIKEEQARREIFSKYNPDVNEWNERSEQLEREKGRAISEIHRRSLEFSSKGYWNDYEKIVQSIPNWSNDIPLDDGSFLPMPGTFRYT